MTAAVPKYKTITSPLEFSEYFDRELDKWGLKGYYPISIFSKHDMLVAVLCKEDHESIHTIIGEDGNGQ